MKARYRVAFHGDDMLCVFLEQQCLQTLCFYVCVYAPTRVCRLWLMYAQVCVDVCPCVLTYAHVWQVCGFFPYALFSVSTVSQVLAASCCLVFRFFLLQPLHSVQNHQITIVTINHTMYSTS